MKREGELKSTAMRELHRQEPAFLILLQATAGAPDRLIAGNGKVSGWEFKHGTPTFSSKGDQELFCLRLDAQGIPTRYVIWQESWTGLNQRTLIVHPREVQARTLVPEACCIGYDMSWLVKQIRKVHELH